MSIWVYDFDRKIKSGRAPLKTCWVVRCQSIKRWMGLPVPPGFTISTEACNEFYKEIKNT